MLVKASFAVLVGLTVLWVVSGFMAMNLATNDQPQGMWGTLVVPLTLATPLGWFAFSVLRPRHRRDSDDN